MSTPIITVFLVDDHELVRRGIANFLASTDDIAIVGEAASAGQAIGRIRAVDPDVVLLDVRLPDGSGIDVCRELASTLPGTRCIILTAYNDDEAILAAVVAGAAGYIRKDVAGDTLIDGIHAVAAGRSLLDPGLVARVTRNLRDARAGDPRLAGLTRRDRDVLTLIADGLSNREIAVRLSLAEKTVKNYVSTVLAKLGLHSRTQAAVMQKAAAPPDSDEHFRPLPRT